MFEIPTVERALDLDSHEMVPTEMYAEVFGHPELQEAALKFAGSDLQRQRRLTDERVCNATADAQPIDYDSVWNVKGSWAPSAIDLTRRPAVLDAMGIDRQLVYPTFGLLSMALLRKPNAHLFFGYDPATLDSRRLGREGVVAHNRWAEAITKRTTGRVRPVGIVLTDTIAGMMSEAEQLIANGVRALMIPAGNPPGDTSPADSRLDPFWRLAAEANVPVTLHLGADYGFLSSASWSDNVDVFNASSQSTLEFIIEPLRASTLHLAAENFLSAIVLGGVFERHPQLRFGVIEMAASWVGPLAERLDMWAEQQFRSRFARVLSMRPSEYISRNVRVTPFHFEPVAYYLERYPQLSDVYAYSTDYPHVEGGKDSMRVHAEGLRDVSPELRDKFFYRNGALLLPD